MLLIERTASKQVWDTFRGKKRAEEDFFDCGEKKSHTFVECVPRILPPHVHCNFLLFSGGVLVARRRLWYLGHTANRLICGMKSQCRRINAPYLQISRINFQSQHLCRRETNNKRRFIIIKIYLSAFIEDRYSPSQQLFHGVHACVRLCFEGRWGVDLPMYGVMWLDSITVNLVLLLSSCHCVKTNNHRQVQLSRQRNLRNMFCACICRAKSITATSTWSVPSASCWWMTSKKYFVSAESLFDGKPAPHYTNGKSKRAKSWRCEGFTFCCQKYLHRILHNKAVNSSEVWHELNESLIFPHSGKLKKSWNITSHKI